MAINSSHKIMDNMVTIKYQEGMINNTTSNTNNNNIRNNEDASISNRRARILILTESMKKDHVEIDPKAKEYRAVMNCAFSAEKLNILIDCFNVSPLSSTTLFTESEMSKMQQACYVSNGLYWSRSIDAKHKDQINYIIIGYNKN